MPFTANEFLDVFAAYNQALWPFAAALWLLTTLVCAALIAGASLPALFPRLLLAAHWLWAGVMYHALFFSAINPAAWVFAALFIAQGLLFAASSTHFSTGRGVARRVAASVLIIYSLLYPVVVWTDGFVYPRMPTYGVPCPTVILTLGLLIAASPPSILLSVIPIAWSFMGATAVWLFGVDADLALPAAGAVLIADLILRRSHVMRKLSLASVFIALIASLAFARVSPVLAQAAQHDHQQQAQTGGMKMDGMKMSDMKMDGKMMEEMAAKKKANTERINVLMATVKSTTGEAKVAAMADIIGVLLEERSAMQEHCAAMMAMMKK